MGCNVITALNDTLFLFLLSTDKPRGTGGYSSSWGNRLPLALLGVHLPNQGTSKLHSASELAKQPSGSPLPKEELFLLRFQSLILGFAGSNNPFSL